MLLGQHMSDEQRAKISATKMGHEVSVEARAKISVKLSVALLGNTRSVGRHNSTETRAKMSAALKGYPYWGPEHQSPETVAKRSAANRGKSRSDISRAKMSSAQKGHKVSLTTRAKLAAANTGKHPSPETLAKMSKSLSNPSAETRAKISAKLKGHIKWGPEHQTPETRAKISLANKGRKISPEICAKLSAAGIGHHPISPELREKMSVSHKGQHAWNKGKPMSEASRVAIFSVEAQTKSAATRWKGGDQVSGAKAHAKRRVLGFSPLNSWFLNCEGHHIDVEQVIHLPKKLHRGISHNFWTGKNMPRINAEAYNFLFKQEVESALAILP